MKFAKRYDVYADKIKLGSVMYNGKSEFDKFEDWEFYNLTTDFGGDGLTSMTSALECLLDEYKFDETYVIRLQPVT